MKLRALPHLLVPLTMLVCGCGPPAWPNGVDGPRSALAAQASSRDRPGTIDVGSWNVEWFGAPDRGPRDDERQADNIAHVLEVVDLDLVGLVEVVSAAAFEELVARLPGYQGVLVTDEGVSGGDDEYGDDEQKVAMLVRDRFTVTGARVVLADHAWSFAGRPPLEVSLGFTERGRPRTLDVVVVHFKAMADAGSYQRRVQAAAALRDWLAQEHAHDWALVIGDFNDDLDASTWQGRTSPFDELAHDPSYRFTTRALTDAGVSTTVWHGATIDHHLATASLARRFVEGSAEVLQPDGWVADYDQTTSDHYPVVTSYDLR